VFRLFAITLGLVALAVLVAVFVFVFSFLSCFSVRKMSGVVTILNFFGAGLMLAAGVVSIFLYRAGHGGDFAAASIGFGAPIAMAAFIYIGLLNRKLWKHGIVVEFGEGDAERAEIFKKVKAGTLKLSQLPYPVVETAATRALEAIIQADLARNGAEGGGTT
jgi:hypothetical protein